MYRAFHGELPLRGRLYSIFVELSREISDDNPGWLISSIMRSIASPAMFKGVLPSNQDMLPTGPPPAQRYMLDVQPILQGTTQSISPGAIMGYTYPVRVYDFKAAIHQTR
jgi:hypothetical protein